MSTSHFKLLISSALVALSLATAHADAQRPNIILVMPDDVGVGDYACLGNPVIHTPSVDAFKKQSLAFTQFHVSPTCSPCRSALLSGRHEFRTGVTHTILERERMSLKTYTLSQMLKSVGYTTGIFGKWHLGDEEAYRPESRGFDEVYIHGGGGIGQTFPGSCGDAPGNTNIDPALWHNDKWEKTKGYCTDLFFAQATKWMDGARSGEKPFFAYIPLNAAHGPHVVPKEYYQQYLGKPGVSEETAKFLGMVENIDTNFGKLLATLKEWGIEDNTLVIFFTGDNGGTDGMKIFNGGLRGGKGSAYQGRRHARDCLLPLARWQDPCRCGVRCLERAPRHLPDARRTHRREIVRPGAPASRGTKPAATAHQSENRMARSHACSSPGTLGERQGRRLKIRPVHDSELAIHAGEQHRTLRPES